MKKSKELDVDSIGEQNSLTKEQEKLISEFLKSELSKRQTTTSKSKSKRKTTA